MIHGHFHSFVGARAERLSGYHSYLLDEALAGTARNLSSGAEQVHRQFLIGSQHTGDPLDWFQAAAHGSLAPVTGDGARSVFANHQGRAAVRPQTMQWLNACFPLAVNKESGADTSPREHGNRDNDFENRKQSLKV